MAWHLTCHFQKCDCWLECCVVLTFAGCVGLIARWCYVVCICMAWCGFPCCWTKQVAESAVVFVSIARERLGVWCVLIDVEVLVKRGV